MLQRLVTFWIFLILSAASAVGAQITHISQAGAPVVIVDGALVPEDVARFSAVASPLKRATVLLKSEGGSLHAGIEIGRIIRKRGFSTRVSSRDGRCASACGFAWLAGSPRMLDTGSMVGFHAVYTLNHGKTEVNSIGNAIVGGYMRELGLSDEAIIYATQAPPSSMRWLSIADSKAIGLDVQYVDDRSLAEIARPIQAKPIEEVTTRKILGATKVKTIKVRPKRGLIDNILSPR